jgi:hypothetical protein
MPKLLSEQLADLSVHAKHAEDALAGAVLQPGFETRG